MTFFCPLADEAGNLADWAAVIVALLGAIAVYLLSRAANATAKDAKEIHHQEALARREAADREARLILIYLEPELRQANSALEQLTTGLDIVEHDTFVINGNARQRFAVDVSAISVRLCKELFPRLHVLSDSHAMNIARTVSGLEAMKTAATEAAGIDLSEVMLGAGQEHFDEFRRECLSSAYSLLRSGSRDLVEKLARLIDAAVMEKEKLDKAM